MIKKTLFISGLVAIAISASLFMVIESARFYISHYPQEPWKGYWLAGMLEVFVMLLAMIKVGGFWRQFFQKSIMAALFLIIIFAAGFYATAPTLRSMADSGRADELKSILKTEISELKDEFDTFQKQNQRGNTAKTANRREKAFEELKSLLKENTKINKGNFAIINVVLLFIIRITVQTSNIYCAWMIGYIYRNGVIKTPKKPKGKAPLCACGCGLPVKWSERKNEWNKAIDGHQFKETAIETYKKRAANRTGQDPAD